MPAKRNRTSSTRSAQNSRLLEVSAVAHCKLNRALLAAGGGKVGLQWRGPPKPCYKPRFGGGHLRLPPRALGVGFPPATGKARMVLQRMRWSKTGAMLIGRATAPR